MSNRFNIPPIPIHMGIDTHPRPPAWPATMKRCRDNLRVYVGKYSPRECVWRPKSERPTRKPLHDVERARRFLLQHGIYVSGWYRNDTKRYIRLRDKYERECERAGVIP